MTKHIEAADPAEAKIKGKLENLLIIRRRYLRAADKTQKIKVAGNRAFAALETEIRASLQLPKPTVRGRAIKA